MKMSLFGDFKNPWELLDTLEEFGPAEDKWLIKSAVDGNDVSEITNNPDPGSNYVLGFSYPDPENLTSQIPPPDPQPPQDLLQGVFSETIGENNTDFFSNREQELHQQEQQQLQQTQQQQQVQAQKQQLPQAQQQQLQQAQQHQLQQQAQQQLQQQAQQQQQQQQQQQPLIPQYPLVNGSGIITVNHDQQMSEQEYTNLSNSQPAITFANTATNNGLVYLLQPPPTAVAQKQQAVHVSQNGGTIDVPALKDMRGNYDFNVTVEEKERTTKSPMWLMSKITNKLYTNINKAVPFEVRLNNLVPRNRQLIIRAVAVFSSAQFLRTNVTRCPNHASLVDPTNHDFPYPDHVVRADHPGAQYECSPNGRLSVVVPLDTLQDGSSFTPILLRFMCLGSCVGGINRRPIAIILTLEDREGLILGRKVIDVRVCACPTRDIKTDEAALTNKGPKRKSSVLGSQDKVFMPIRKKPKYVEPKSEPQEDETIFTIQVRGRKLYDFMLEMKKVYYKTHPEYAAKYPEDLSLQTDEESGDDLTSKNLQIDVGEAENLNWDSGGDSPQRIVINQDPLSGTLVAKNSGSLRNPTPNITISTQPFHSKSLYDYEEMHFSSRDHGTEFVPGSGAHTNGIIFSTSKGMNANSTSEMVPTQIVETVNYITNHIPVRQVPSKPGSSNIKSKVMPSLKPASAQNGVGKSSKSYKKKMKESVSFSSLDSSLDSVETNSDYTETNYCDPFTRNSSSPMSAEMEAANILAGGFKNKSVLMQ